MTLKKKRAIVTLRPEWESELIQLKKEQFYDKTQADMFRYLIALGLESLKTEEPPAHHPDHTA